MKGLLGRKLGMTQVFTEDGVLIPVTVVEVTPNVVLQKKTVETDGYNAVQLGFEEIKEKRTTKANIGHCKKQIQVQSVSLRKCAIATWM